MKKLLGVLALALAGPACQPQTSGTAVSAPVAPVVQVALAAPVVSAIPTPAAPAESAVSVAPAVQVASVLAPAESASPVVPLSGAKLARAQQYNLSSLLQTVHHDRQHADHAQNGFFGPEHYRIAVAMTKVRRDPKQPTIYYLTGKNMYKNRVTPFTGTFTVTQIIRQPKCTAKEIARAKEDSQELEDIPNSYSTVGNFELREAPTQYGAGVFRGQLAIDWHLEDDGLVALWEAERPMSCQRSMTQGGDIKYEGTWTSYHTQRVSSVVWVEDIFAYAEARNVLQNFAVLGERSATFNPKYAKLGWNDYWENQEWWVDEDESEPSASL